MELTSLRMLPFVVDVVMRGHHGRTTVPLALLKLRRRAERRGVINLLFPNAQRVYEATRDSDGVYRLALACFRLRFKL